MSQIKKKKKTNKQHQNIKENQSKVQEIVRVKMDATAGMECFDDGGLAVDH